MPYDDTPRWEDVIWDHRAAGEAQGALRRAAAEIERALADEQRQAVEAAIEWRGDSRAEFERRSTRLRGELSALVAACLGVAEDVSRASARAAEEQHERERAREEWEREQRRRRTNVA